MTRLFVAFPVPSVVLLELQRKFTSYDLAFTKEFHLTLKFLGEVGDDKISEIIQHLQQIRASMPTFSFSHLGTFSDPDGQPRVLWVALQPEEPLQVLHTAVEQALQGQFPRDTNYKPHITFGRFTSDKYLSVLPSVLKMAPPHFAFMIKELCLYKSEQQQDGSYKHVVLAKIPLQS